MFAFLKIRQAAHHLIQRHAQPPDHHFVKRGGLPLAQEHARRLAIHAQRQGQQVPRTRFACISGVVARDGAAFAAGEQNFGFLIETFLHGQFERTRHLGFPLKLFRVTHRAKSDDLVLLEPAQARAVATQLGRQFVADGHGRCQELPLAIHLQAEIERREQFRVLLPRHRGLS